MMEYRTMPRKKKRGKRRRKSGGKSHNEKGRHDAVRYAVGGFFSWPKNGFYSLRTRYERRAEESREPSSCVCQHRVTCDAFQSIRMSS